MAAEMKVWPMYMDSVDMPISSFLGTFNLPDGKQSDLALFSHLCLPISLILRLKAPQKEEAVTPVHAPGKRQEQGGMQSHVSLKPLLLKDLCQSQRQVPSISRARKQETGPEGGARRITG